MRGAIRYKQGRYDDAVINFDRAIERDNNYFVHYLSRGLTFAKQKQNSRAKTDLNQSVRLLPTATAYQALGQLAEDEGDLESAKQYYAQAGQGQGAEGQAARLSLTRLELPERPDKYIEARVGRDDRNRYVVQVRNRAALPVKLRCRIKRNRPVRRRPKPTRSNWKRRQAPTNSVCKRDNPDAH